MVKRRDWPKAAVHLSQAVFPPIVAEFPEQLMIASAHASWHAAVRDCLRLNYQASIATPLPTPVSNYIYIYMDTHQILHHLPISSESAEYEDRNFWKTVTTLE